MVKNKVRLTEEELKAIKETAIKVFGENVKVWIFGSRADLKKKGGDIDIYIELEHFDKKEAFRNKINFLIELEDKIGEQKIDIIISPSNCEEYYCKEAKKTGVRIL